MAWETMPIFADGQLVKKEQLYTIINNVTALKNSAEQKNRGPVLSSASAEQALTSSLSKITFDEATIELEVVHGGDILVYGHVPCIISSVVNAGSVGLSLYVDEMPYQDGGSGSYSTAQRIGDFNVALNPIWIVEGLSPGIHTFELYAQEFNTSNITVRQGRFKFVAVEL